MSKQNNKKIEKEYKKVESIYRGKLKILKSRFPEARFACDAIYNVIGEDVYPFICEYVKEIMKGNQPNISKKEIVLETSTAYLTLKAESLVRYCAYLLTLLHSKNLGFNDLHENYDDWNVFCALEGGLYNCQENQNSWFNKGVINKDYNLFLKEKEKLHRERNENIGSLVEKQFMG